MKQPRDAKGILQTFYIRQTGLPIFSSNGLCKDQVAFMLSDLDITFALHLSPIGKHQCTASLLLPGVKVVLT